LIKFLTSGIISGGRSAGKEYRRKTNGRDEMRSADCVYLRVVGSDYVSRAFGDYLRLVDMKHILTSPFHSQTNGKVERFGQTLKGEVNQVSYEMPSELQGAIDRFVSYYNHQRYHEA